MQLQRSLFSFYDFFVRKTPIILWIVIAIILMTIIGWQIKQIQNQQYAYNFQKCIFQYYNQTRLSQQDWKQYQKQKQKQKINNNTTDDEAKKQKIKQISYNLTSPYYMILNETTTLKIYFSDDIKYSENQSSCKIILNTQTIRIKLVQQSQKSPQQDNSIQSKGATILQQILLDDKKQQSQPDTIISEKDKQNIEIETKKNQKIRPINVKIPNQLTNQQKQYLINQHPSFHIAANSHIVYLNQDNNFQEKHGVKVHAIILSRQNFNMYPQFLSTFTSKIWRFHGNDEIMRNQITMKSLAKSFQSTNKKVKQIYKINYQTYRNQTQKKIQQIQKRNNTQNKDIVTDKINTKIDTQKQIISDSNIKNNSQKLTSVQGDSTNQVISIIPFQIFQPISQIKLYFHYPQTLRYEELLKLVFILQNKTIFIYNFFFLAFIFVQYVLLSCLIGLFLRYLLIWIITIYLFAGGCFINKQWGWVFKYFNLVRKRNNQDNDNLFISSFKMIILFTIALLGMLTIFTFGSKYILQNLYIYSMTLSGNYYSQMIIKNFFIIQLYYYICCRSRLALKFFPIFSLQITFLILFLCQKFYFYNISWLINLHILIHLLLMCIFSALENRIGQSPFYNQFTPSIQRPRALYYIGYDISWQNTIPPIWTYFTSYFDLKHFDQRQKALIDRDYQLLYGRLLGMNERQQLPEDQQVENDQQVDKLNQNLSQSNQMSLIR